MSKPIVVIVFALLSVFHSGCASQPKAIGPRIEEVGMDDPYFGSPKIRISDAKVIGEQLVVAIEFDREPGSFIAQVDTGTGKMFATDFKVKDLGSFCYLMVVELKKGMTQRLMVGAQSAINGYPVTRQIRVEGKKLYTWQEQAWRRL